jgi:hypothetical protein
VTNYLFLKKFGPAAETAVETTTLIHNEEESFALAPVEATAIRVS